ncbi:MAG TPA: hypothetical protein VJW20_06005 [Candidatus Angelobacter sp.]|nr:hypothetical protein [Candidatus Angelobacter sp.]
MTPDQWERGRQKWERDLLNRQRNIVFPDTVLNEGQFFRNMVSGQIQFNLVQKMGILVITASFLVTGCVGTALALGSLFATQDTMGRCIAFIPVFVTVSQMGFGIIVMIRGLTATPITDEETNQRLPPALPPTQP